LNFQNAFAKLAGDVDLRLRGTVATPSLQGRISITEGSAIIAGTRYDLQRGDISFTNPVRIEPLIDLSATARVEDYDITLNLHGTPDKMAVTYRSDPPLPESDVVALLALGRTQKSAAHLHPAAGTGPLQPHHRRPARRRPQRHRQQPHPKALRRGLRQSRSQLPRPLRQLHLAHHRRGAVGPQRHPHLRHRRQHHRPAVLQAEIAINRHVSLLVARDESGVFSMVVKATRRFHNICRSNLRGSEELGSFSWLCRTERRMAQEVPSR
jgi:translocation and assembly module TamB